MPTGLKAKLSVQRVSKAFVRPGESHTVIKSFNLDVFEGEFLSVFGPNGCGKSTLLHLIAGIIFPDAGSITLHHQEASPLSVGIVFQNYEKSLLPWRTCLDNIALPLETQGNMPKQARREKARAVLRDLGLNLPLNHYPYQMSGGQKQLTCISRAMVQQPSLLLLDEPFASLDYQTRMEMQSKLQEIWLKTNVTTIFISHEIDEAIFLADRLLLLTSRPARIAKCFDVQLPRPRDISTFSSPDFVFLKADILDSFTKEVMP